ncbi:MAG: DNA repair protein RadC [Prevotella sp.]
MLHCLTMNNRQDSKKITTGFSNEKREKPDVATNKLTINQWAEEDRPREKLERLGPSALTNAELLAILIGSGSTDESAVDLMKRLLSACNNNLNTLGKCTIHDLQGYKGIGPAKAVTIIAACELGKRRAMEKAEERDDLGSPQAIYDYMHPRMQDLDVEEAWVLLMNQNYKLIKSVCISHGGISETAVDVRVIMREAVLCNATVLALCHNHPSNNLRPSADDDRLTQRVKQAAETMRIYFLDHIIVTDGQYYSYLENGKL